MTRSRLVGFSRSTARSPSAARAAGAEPVGLQTAGSSPCAPYPRSVPPLSPDQRRPSAPPPVRCSSSAAPGTGKTTRPGRALRLAGRRGAAPEAVLVPTRAARPTRCAPRIEARLDRGFEELHVHTVPGFCARLLHDEAIEAGLGPVRRRRSAGRPARDAAGAHRRAELRRHDLRGSPAAMLARHRRAHRPPQGRGRHRRRATPTWAATLPDGERRTRARARVRRHLPRARPDAGEQALLDAGELVLRALALLRERPHVRARRRGALAPRARRRPPRPDLRAGAAGHAARRRARQLTVPATTTRRSAASAAPPPRTCASSRRSARRHRGPARAQPALPERVVRAAEAVVAPNPGRIAKRLEGREAPAARSLLALRRTSARRRRPSPPTPSGWCARAPRPSGIARARALGAQRGPGGRRGARGARGPLPARRAPRRSSSAPRCATCSPGCGCSSTRPTPAPSCARSRARRSSCAPLDLARCIQISRRRKLDMVSRARRRDRVAAAAARGARAGPRVPEAPPRRPRARWTPRARTCSSTA